MFKHIIHFIHSIRIVLFALIVLSFLHIADVNPISMSYFLGAKFGSAIGMSTSVPENPMNKLALQLKAREAELDEREQNLLKHEVELSKNREQILLYGIAGGIAVLFLLILLNFYLDAKRRRRE
ncbi:MAG: hypothetical protein U9Q85_00620 [Patescibacteria group bacterium]|nr:hypothetical protein [Patescibacteria group bacterium]